MLGLKRLQWDHVSSSYIFCRLEVSPASPRPGRGGGGTNTGSLNCSPCQQEDFSPIQKSQKKNVSQGPENSSCKGPGSKYFRLCRPHGLCHFSPLPPHHKNSSRQYVNEETWLCSNLLTILKSEFHIIPTCHKPFFLHKIHA